MAETAPSPNPEFDAEAQRLRDEHGKLSDELGDAEIEADEVADINYELTRGLYPDFEVARTTLSVDESKQRLEENIDVAKGHVDQHLGEYMEIAHQEDAQREAQANDAEPAKTQLPAAPESDQ